MKTFKVKNYKGNLVESLSRFQKNHKGMKIVEACEDGKDLKIQAEGQYDDAPPNPDIIDVGEVFMDAFKSYEPWFTDMVLDPENEDMFEDLLTALRKLANELKQAPNMPGGSYPHVVAAVDDLEEQYNEYQEYWKDK